MLRVCPPAAYPGHHKHGEKGESCWGSDSGQEMGEIWNKQGLCLCGDKNNEKDTTVSVVEGGVEVTGRGSHRVGGFQASPHG